MSAATTGSEAARLMARARWGTQKLDGMIAELAERRDELGTEQLDSLRSLVAAADTEGDPR